MRLPIFMILILATPCFADAEREDMLRFENGDQLHGRFEGIAPGPSVLWKREDVGEEVKFQATELRQIVLNGGRPELALSSLSHIGTVNGDRVPGHIRSLDEKEIVIETKFAGPLTFPRDQVGLLAPSPLGGRVLYHGPFNASEWKDISYAYPEGIPVEKPDDKNGKAIPRWEFSGSAWYWQQQEMGTALVRKSGLPDRAILQFDIAWKNRLSMAIGFHADFSRPKPDAEEEGEGDAQNASTSLPGLFGNSYVIHLYANYVRLFRTSFDAEGRPRMDPVQTANGNMRLGESGNARVELRFNRVTGEIVLFIDGEFVVQWSELTFGDGIVEANGYAGKGDGYGFVVQSENSPVRISEIIVAEWNGMPDAARSLQVDNADIVLLTNGTDRFSGTVTGVRDGKLTLESRYGDFTFPMDEIAEVRFAKSGLSDTEKDLNDTLKVRFYPMGRISGQALDGGENSLRMLNSAAGEMDLKLDSAVMLEFRSTESFLDDWDTDF